MVNPEQDGPAVTPLLGPRPLGRQPDPASNGTSPSSAERTVFEAVEDLRTAIKAAGLPPLRIDWQDGPPGETDTDPEFTARVERLMRRMSDITSIGSGPQPAALAAVVAPVEPDHFLVDGLIRPGTTIMLTGPPSSAKSWASRQLGIMAAVSASSFLDHYPIARPLNVLVIDEDNGPDEEWRREESLIAHLELPRSALTNIFRVSLENVQLDQETWQAWLRGLIEAYELDLVILDPISEMHGGKELREDPAFRSLLSFLKRLKVDFPSTAVLLVHHTRKLPASERSGSRGVEDVRGQWGQTPDVVVMMWPLGDRRLAWEVHKRVPHSKLLLEQIPEDELGEGALRFVADETTQHSRAMLNDGKVINAIRGGMVTHGEIRDATTMPRSTVTNVLGRLIRARIIAKKGQVYEVLEDSE